MRRQAVDLLNVKILTDTDFTIIPRRDKINWKEVMTIVQVATLVRQYFCPRRSSDNTLAELFSKLPFHYSITSQEEELQTYMRYNKLVEEYERVRGLLTKEQHVELISILEKRLPK